MTPWARSPRCSCYFGRRAATISATRAAQEEAECSATTRRRSSSPTSRRTRRVRAREIEQSLREIVGIVGSEPKPYGQASEELVEGGVVRQDRQPGCTRFADDLVEGLRVARLRRAEERVGRTEQIRDLLPAHGRSESGLASATGCRSARGDQAPRDAAARHRSAEALAARDVHRARAPSHAESLRAAMDSPSPARSGPGQAATAARRAPVGSGDGENRSTSIAWPIACSLGVGSGNARASAVNTASASRTARRSERLASPCVYQRRSVAPRAFASRSSEHEEEWDHVREHGGPVPSAQLGSELPAGSAPRDQPYSRRRRPARAHSRAARAGRRSRRAPPPRRTDLQASADEVERLREDGMVGVESLGDEDESQPASRAAASVRSTSSLIEAANCSAE